MTRVARRTRATLGAHIPPGERRSRQPSPKPRVRGEVPMPAEKTGRLARLEVFVFRPPSPALTDTTLSPPRPRLKVHPGRHAPTVRRRSLLHAPRQAACLLFRNSLWAPAPLLRSSLLGSRCGELLRGGKFSATAADRHTGRTLRCAAIVHGSRRLRPHPGIRFALPPGSNTCYTSSLVWRRRER